MTMKKLFFAVTAALLLSPALLSAQRTTTKTWFDGERITGVAASAGFDVVLVKSDRAKAVVEVSEEIESYVKISRDGSGIVSVGRRDLNSREQREFNRLREGRKLTMRMTLYLPTLSDIRLSSSAGLSSTDSFSGNELDILASSSASILGDFKVESERVKVQCSSSSKIENLILDSTTELTVVASSSARVAISAQRLAYSKLGLSSSASLELSGAGTGGQWSVSSSARINAVNFNVGDLSVNASSSGRLTANVVADGADLSISASSSANVTIAARGVGTSNIDSTSGASVNISGNGNSGKWDTTSSGRIVADEFALKDLTVEATSGSSVRANVSGTLTTRTSSGGSVRYAGNPARVNDLSSGVRPL
jgi:hypothetical protein